MWARRQSVAGQCGQKTICGWTVCPEDNLWLDSMSRRQSVAGQCGPEDNLWLDSVARRQSVAGQYVQKTICHWIVCPEDNLWLDMTAC
nr:hypothetical protein BgiMline_022712 [Biomphalaria glabrata]